MKSTDLDLMSQFDEEKTLALVLSLGVCFGFHRNYHYLHKIHIQVLCLIMPNNANLRHYYYLPHLYRLLDIEQSKCANHVWM